MGINVDVEKSRLNKNGFIKDVSSCYGVAIDEDEVCVLKYEGRHTDRIYTAALYVYYGFSCDFAGSNENLVGEAIRGVGNRLCSDRMMRT